MQGSFANIAGISTTKIISILAGSLLQNVIYLREFVQDFQRDIYFIHLCNELSNLVVCNNSRLLKLAITF